MIGIYKIENPVGKIYIGQSTDIEARMRLYKRLKCKSQQLLFNSFKKYGFESHKMEILTTCLIDELDTLEVLYIEQFNTTNRTVGLNLTTGGYRRFSMTPEVKAKMSLAQMGNKKALGRKQSKEEIEKRVLKLKGKTRTIEQRNRISAGKMGFKTSEATLKKLRVSRQYMNSKKVVNQKTGIVFNRVQDAAIFYGLKKTTLTAMLNGQTKINKTDLRYV